MKDKKKNETNFPNILFGVLLSNNRRMNLFNRYRITYNTAKKNTNIFRHESN